MDQDELGFAAAYGYVMGSTAIQAATAVDRQKAITGIISEEEEKGMSMDLAKQTFRTEPDYFIAGTTIRITTAVKEAGEPLEAHTPVKLEHGIVTAIAKADGAVSTVGIYGITADSAVKDEDVVVYLTGEFFADGLVLAEGVTAADVEVPLRNIGIFLK